MASERRKLSPAIEHLVDTGRGYFGRVRVRVFSLVLGIGLAATALVLWTPLGWVPVVGVAVAAAVVAVHRAGHRLIEPVCYHCGKELKGLPDGEHGILCPGCGALHQGRRMALGNRPDPRSVQLHDEQDERVG
jgi:DNA-directed RNA polymerase subunit RPC12/RpoP